MERKLLPFKLTPFSVVFYAKFIASVLNRNFNTTLLNDPNPSKALMSSDDFIIARYLLDESRAAGHQIPSSEVQNHHLICDRSYQIDAYNQCAQSFGIKVIIIDDFKDLAWEIISGQSESWIGRTLRRTSSIISVQDRKTKHRTKRVSSSNNLLKKDAIDEKGRKTKHTLKRAFSSSNLLYRNDAIVGKDLKELGRLCGECKLKIDCVPEELYLPTHIAATAENLLTYGLGTEGIFQDSGKQTIVQSIYDHYAITNEDEDTITGTVRQRMLPDRFRLNHLEVAATLMRFLSVLPGGILGELHLFHALADIYFRFKDENTMATLCRAELIALAIETVNTISRRHLIYGIFAILHTFGELAKKTKSLIEYEALGVAFGPLLIGEYLNYNMPQPHPKGKLVVLPVSSPKSHKKNKGQIPLTDDKGFLSVYEKKRLASGIVEMVSSHWEEVKECILNPPEHRSTRGIKGARTPDSSEYQLRSPTPKRRYDPESRLLNQQRHEKHEQRLEKQKSLASVSKLSQSPPSVFRSAFEEATAKKSKTSISNESIPEVMSVSPKRISPSEKRNSGFTGDFSIKKSPAKPYINFSKPYRDNFKFMSSGDDVFGPTLKTVAPKLTELQMKFEELSKSNKKANLTNIVGRRTPDLCSPKGPSEPTRRMISSAPDNKKKSYGHLGIAGVLDVNPKMIDMQVQPEQQRAEKTPLKHIARPDNIASLAKFNKTIDQFESAVDRNMENKSAKINRKDPSSRLFHQTDSSLVTANKPILESNNASNKNKSPEPALTERNVKKSVRGVSSQQDGPTAESTQISQIPKKSLYERSKARLTGLGKSSRSGSGSGSGSSIHSHKSLFSLKGSSLPGIKKSISKTFNGTGTKVTALKAIYEPNNSVASTPKRTLRKSIPDDKRSIEIPKSLIAPYTYNPPSPARSTTRKAQLKSIEQHKSDTFDGVGHDEEIGIALPGPNLQRQSGIEDRDIRAEVEQIGKALPDPDPQQHLEIENRDLRAQVLSLQKRLEAVMEENRGMKLTITQLMKEGHPQYRTKVLDIVGNAGLDGAKEFELDSDDSCNTILRS
ncbi:hypothetical protein HYALB_00004906 [Hymenoscyphus albidus]|uniref:Rho-GAP domain-containing protein n=1 Tax=Hymenoscyphus albidus TaxID=595503 RepID=A0A9N9LG49_9HELO|nr:hypothetical protein HYALB_00004906 [Hymenoscyphus albidus]